MKPILILFCALSARLLGQTVDPAELLAESDRGRGGHLPGVSWNIDFVSQDDDGEVRQSMFAVSNNNNTHAEYTAPRKIRGQFVLMLGHNMWFGRPGLQRPVPISPRQRLIGQAANGDIAATNYRDDYHASLVKIENVDGDRCAVLDLTAKSKYVTYDRIRYWVSLSRRVGVKAEFYTVSGRLIKTATFEYNNVVAFNGAQLPFASTMTIVDALRPSCRTQLHYSNVTVGRANPALFELPL
jgi:hypothetical protein